MNCEFNVRLRNKHALIIGLGCAVLGACAHRAPAPGFAFETRSAQTLDQQDLVSDGLSLEALRSASVGEVNAQDAASLQRAAYHAQFRALNDLSDAGGYGRLFGLSAQRAPVSGRAHWVQRVSPAGLRHTVLLQVPDKFGPNGDCLVVVPSSGSRHVLGGVATAGAWALQRGCAVVYTDKGTGTAVRVANDPRRHHMRGVYSEGQAIDAYPFTGNQPDDVQVAMQHANSGYDPAPHWGEFTLDAVHVAEELLARETGVSGDQLKVLGASVSNGGGALLQALEIDHARRIDAVVVAEPQVHVASDALAGLWLQQGAEAPQPMQSLPLLRLAMLSALYEPCASLHASLDAAPFKAATALLQASFVARCEALAEAGLLSGGDVQALAADALKQLEHHGLTPQSANMIHVNAWLNLAAAIGVTYTHAALAASAQAAPCDTGFVYFNAQGQPEALPESVRGTLFAHGSGIAPSAGIQPAVRVAGQWRTFAQLPALGLATLQCLQRRIESIETEDAGLHASQRDRPVILLHGRADGTVPVNHASRAYVAAALQHDPDGPVRYYEISNAQHFDAFLAWPGFSQVFAPMHPHFEQALDLMWLHLTTGAPLPPNQLLQDVPRGSQPMTPQHLAKIQSIPDKPIVWRNRTLEVPE